MTRSAPSPDLEVDRSTLESLYRAHFDFAWRTLRRYGVPDAQLDDATQDVFLVVRRRLPDFSPDLSQGRSPRAWLHGIARRVARDRRRSEERRSRRLALVAPPAPSRDPEHQLSARELAAVIGEHLQTRREGERELLALHLIEGMGGRELAEALGMNENTVYAALRRGRARLEAALRERFPGWEAQDFVGGDR